MLRYQPKTTLRLILHGFAVVALPLLIALILAGVYMDRLLEQSQEAVNKAVQATRDSRMLGEQLISLERRGRQYLVLQDPASLQAYRDIRQELRVTAERLHRLTHESPQQRLVERLITAEGELSKLIERNDPQPDASGVDVADHVAERFAQLEALTGSILDGSNRLIDREVDAMQRTGSGAQRLLVAVAAALLPLTLLSVAVFTALIARPIRRVDRSIHRLGDGNFDQVIEIEGPQDLQHLGHRLDWLRQRLRDLENQKTRFLQHISHELKTPLTAIRESADLIHDRVVGPLNPQQREISQILMSNARQLQALIEDLLDFGTANSHSLALQRSDLELHKLAESVAKNHKPALLAKELRLDCALEPLRLNADRDKLAVVIDNLLSNAIKYSPPGGCLSLRLRRTQAAIELTVSDEGPGIAAEDQPHIFEAFYQGRIQSPGHLKGSGLGLSIAREYISAHGGSLRIDGNTAVGARFVIELPDS